jgi:PIN domain nuclease of toxin-antitoxin system
MILLDTCCLLWLVMEPDRLTETAKQTLRQHVGMLHVSAITAFEIGQKHAAAKLDLPFAPAEWFGRACTAHGLTILPLTAQQAFAAAALPLLHRDPFDRLLTATALLQRLTLLTPDPLIRQYPQVTTTW